MTVDLLRQVLGEYYYRTELPKRYCKIRVPKRLLDALYDSILEDYKKWGIEASVNIKEERSRNFITMADNIIISKSKNTFSVKNISKFRYKLDNFIYSIC